jgi:hypothetical protein
MRISFVFLPLTGVSYVHHGRYCTQENETPEFEMNVDRQQDGRVHYEEQPGPP